MMTITQSFNKRSWDNMTGQMCGTQWGHGELRAIGRMEERAEGSGMPRGTERGEPDQHLEGRRPGAVRLEQKAPHEDRDLYHVERTVMHISLR